GDVDRMTGAKGFWDRGRATRPPVAGWDRSRPGIRPIHRWRRAIAVAAIGLLLVGGVGYAAAGAFVANQVLRVDAMCGGRFADHDPGHWDTDGISAEFALDLDTTPYLMPAFADVTFPSRDERRYTLHAWWVPAASPTAPVVILVHGQSSCRRDPVLLLPAGMLHRNGFSVLLVDLRDHGDSEVEDGRYANGTEEYLDVLGAWDWLTGTRGIPAGRVGLLGESLGAAVAIIAAGEEPRLAALWEGSSYANYRTIANEELRRLGYPTLLMDAGVLMDRVMTGDDVTSKNPDGEIARMAGRPLFIVHGEADVRINVHHAYDLAAAAAAGGTPVEPWIVPGAHHSEAAFIDPTAYERRLSEFFIAALASETALPQSGG
ncbi:MAG TPA: prolyl oligopeptidase family serine peptidase, partial [Candidatus Limnocylindrales bacterium]|nr:prolyl oligopeptidase family serine peptidase [Candidatus Limnocylindrales bacterium]